MVSALIFIEGGGAKTLFSMLSMRFERRLPDVRIRTRKGRYRSISWRSSPPISSSLNARTPRSFWSGCDVCSDP